MMIVSISSNEKFTLFLVPMLLFYYDYDLWSEHILTCTTALIDNVLRMPYSRCISLQGFEISLSFYNHDYLYTCTRNSTVTNVCFRNEGDVHSGSRIINVCHLIVIHTALKTTPIKQTIFTKLFPTFPKSMSPFDYKNFYETLGAKMYKMRDSLRCHQIFGSNFLHPLIWI